VWGWRLTRTRVTAPSQASRRQASGASGPAHPGVAAHRPRAVLQAGQVHDHGQLGADPAGVGQPPALQPSAGQLGQGVGPPLATAAVVGELAAGQGLMAAVRKVRSSGGPAGSPAEGPVGGLARCPASWLAECVFESMAATYQAQRRRQAPTQTLWMTRLASTHRRHQGRGPPDIGGLTRDRA
jgi:hypothetical protein